jgi:hypothetical protein
MCLQKFKTTVFVPRFTHISSTIEIDIEPHDSETDVAHKLIKKLGVIDSSVGLLLSKKSPSLSVDWSKLISYEKVMNWGGKHGYL